MGRPCGCNGPCGCDIRGRNGVITDGAGTPGDPLWIELDLTSPLACQSVMDCVGANIGPGLVFNPVTRDLSVRVSGGENQLTIGPDGGLLVEGAGGGGTGGGATVATLPATVIGSTWGAGSSLWAEGTHQAYEAARNYVATAVHMVHVPLRRSQDLFAMCLARPAVGDYSPGVVENCVQLDHREHAHIQYKPSGDPPVEDSGYFGFTSPVSTGTPTLGEVFDLLGRRAVLVVETVDTAAPSDITSQLRNMVTSYNLVPSIIAAGELVAATSSVGPTVLHNVATTMAGSGVAVGAVIRQRQQVIDYTPAALAALGVSWVFLGYQFADPQDSVNYVAGAVAAYNAAGLQVILLNGHRQYHHDLAVAAGARGSMMLDPIYGTGKITGYRYRGDTLSANWGSPNVGQHSPYSSDIWAGQRDHFRGILRAGQGDSYVIPADVMPPDPPPHENGYWNLAGRAMPLRSGDTYAVQTWFRWNAQIPQDLQRWVGLFVDRPTDQPLVTGANSTNVTIGYEFRMKADGDFVLNEYDGTPGGPVTLFTGPNLYIPVADTYYGMRIEVTPTAIRLYSSIGAYPNFNKVLEATIANPHRYVSGANAGYVFWGRHFNTVPAPREVQMAGFRMSYTGF